MFVRRRHEWNAARLPWQPPTNELGMRVPIRGDANPPPLTKSHPAEDAAQPTEHAATVHALKARGRGECR